MKKYWYVCFQASEEFDLFVVELTDDEFNAVKKYFETMELVTDGGWSGNAGIYSKKYNTKDEAIEAINTETFYD